MFGVWSLLQTQSVVAATGGANICTTGAEAIEVLSVEEAAAVFVIVGATLFTLPSH